MEQISNILFWISNGLLVPVIIGLLYFFVKSTILLGKIAGQYIRRQKREPQIRTWLDSITADTIGTANEEVNNLPISDFTQTVQQVLVSENGVFIDKSINQYELDCNKESDSAKLLIKFGPILGLMGTLIPMGPALAGLSTGDISSMAYNMQVAFATTVLGLFIGAIGFILLQLKQRWIQTDLMRLDFLAELKEEKRTWIKEKESPTETLNS
ncbi:MAG: MotA/TolQ/ExbB proton channel family protein [Bacteroidales bacterium]|jgi:biopolymer transport protein ExbB/TolQ|nr:MotA/TolQ/ExbB proton channel family protein [Bacteroidales bacterium]